MNNDTGYLGNRNDINDLIYTYYTPKHLFKDFILKFNYDYQDEYYHTEVKRSLFTNSKYRMDLVNNRRTIKFI